MVKWLESNDQQTFKQGIVLYLFVGRVFQHYGFAEKVVVIVMLAFHLLAWMLLKVAEEGQVA